MTELSLLEKIAARQAVIEEKLDVLLNLSGRSMEAAPRLDNEDLINLAKVDPEAAKAAARARAKAASRRPRRQNLAEVTL